MNSLKSNQQSCSSIENKILQQTSRQSKQIKKNKNIKYQKRILKESNITKCQGVLISTIQSQKIQQQEISCYHQNNGHTLGYLKRDIFSQYFKIITIQQQKNELIFNCLPFNNQSKQELKINFPFYLNLVQFSSFSVGRDEQIQLYSSSQAEIAEEKFEFIYNQEKQIIGCNRIINKNWLKMFGLNSDILIDFVNKSNFFPYGWLTDKDNQNSFYQSMQKNGFINKQMINYNGQKFNAKIFINIQEEKQQKNKKFQQLNIYYIVNREQYNIKNVENNFRDYFGLKNIPQDLSNKFLEYNNKQCGFRFL